MKRFINQLVFLGFILVLLVGLYSCKVKKEEPSGSYVGYDYYPLTIGSYIIYDVYDTSYAGSTRIDTLYQLKELIFSSFQEGEDTKYVLYQYFKKTTDVAWPDQPDSVWTLVNSSNQLIRTENNISFIKLSFPVKEGLTWNGNARNVYDAHTYTMKKVDQVYNVLGFNYSQTLMVEINKSESIINKDFRYEIYARGIGPIKKDYTVYAYDQASLGTYTIDYGYRKVFLMTEHGQN